MKNILRNIAILTTALTLPVTGFAEQKPIELSKKVTDKGDGTYTLTLETFTRGTTVTTTSVAPTDFVLLLDWSSSMDETITSKEIWTEITTGNFDTNYRCYMATDTDHNKRIYVRKVSRTKAGKTYYRWAYGTTDNFGYNDGNPLTEDTTNRNEPLSVETCNAAGIKVYSVTTSMNRTLALQNAVCSFLDSVESQNPEGDYHRVAIVWYAKGISTSKTLKDYQFHNLTADLKNSLKSSIKGTGNANDDITSLTRTGTHSDEALDKAEDIIGLANPNHRDRVVVFFTDGEPGDMTGRFEDSRARPCLKSAKAIKAVQTKEAEGDNPARYAKIYAVGLMTSGSADNHYYGTDGKSTSKIEGDKYRFMHYVSSNYDLSNVSETTINNYHFNNDLTGAVNINTEAGSGTSGPWGFFKQSDGSDLEAIFEEIGSESANTNKDVNAESTVVLDALTNMFKLPAGTTASKIKLYTCSVNKTNTGENEIWENASTKTSSTGFEVLKAEDNSVLPAGTTTGVHHKEWWVSWEPWNDDDIKSERKDGKLVYDFNGNGTVEITDFIWINSGKVGLSGETDFLEVMGFDYAANFVGPDKDGEDGPITGWKGKKLIIQFDIETDDANTGGINLETNDSRSGVYVKDKSGKYTAIDTYDSPCVYLPYIKIIKKGLNIGESAIFHITKVTGENSKTAVSKDPYSADIILAKTGDSDPEAVVKLRHAGWYMVEESDWTWTFNALDPQWGELITAEAATSEEQQSYLIFTFTNSKNENISDSINAEAAVINNMTTGNKVNTETTD